MHTGLLGLLLSMAASAVMPAEVKPAAGEETLDRAVVEARQLRDLRTAVTRSQDRFFELYNKINRDHRQRMSCRDEASTGSLMKKRRCSTRAEDDQQNEAARGMLNSMEMSAAVQYEERQRDAAAAASTVPGSAAAAGNDNSVLGVGMAADTDTTGAVGRSYVDSGTSGSVAKIEKEKSRFNNNLNELLDKNPELEERAREYLEAKRRYEAALQRQ